MSSVDLLAFFDNFSLSLTRFCNYCHFCPFSSSQLSTLRKTVYSRLVSPSSSTTPLDTFRLDFANCQLLPDQSYVINFTERTADETVQTTLELLLLRPQFSSLSGQIRELREQTNKLFDNCKLHNQWSSTCPILPPSVRDESILTFLC